MPSTISGGAASTMATRRLFIQSVAAGAAALPSLVAACTAPAPSSPTAASAAPTAAAKTGSVLPTYVPLQGGPKPDYPSAGEQYEDGWDNYPSPAPKAWTKGPPGSGGTLMVFSNAYNPPATPLDQNPAWQEVNK